MKASRARVIGLLLMTGSVLIQGCPVTVVVDSIVGDCFGEDTISRSAYNDMNDVEQLLYEENECGRYEPVTVSVSDLLWPF